MFLRGTIQAQSAEDWCSQRGALKTPMYDDATDGLAPPVLDYFSIAARAASYEFPPASKEDPRQKKAGSDSHHAPEAWCSRKRPLQAPRAGNWCSRMGTLQAQIPTRLMTLLSNTPHTNWCCPGILHSIFHRGPLCRLSWTTSNILAWSSIQWPKRSGFLKTSSVGAHHVVD